MNHITPSLSHRSAPSIFNNDSNTQHQLLAERVLTGGPDALMDFELVEYLLSLAMPNKDTKIITQLLMQEFHSLSGLLDASPCAMLKVTGMDTKSVAALKIIQTAILRILAEPIKQDSLLENWHDLINYLHANMAHLVHEQFRILHLNDKNCLIHDDIMSEGSTDQCLICIRMIIKRALDVGSSAIILVHNHPNGDQTPSQQDISLTKEIAFAGKKIGISVHDHIIITKNGYTSLRNKNLM